MTRLDSGAATVTVDVVSINDAPHGTSTTVSMVEDGTYVFGLGDFGFSDPNDTPADAFSGVTVTMLPLAGSLLNGGGAVTAGQTISAATSRPARSSSRRWRTPTARATRASASRSRTTAAPRTAGSTAIRTRRR